MRKRDELLKEPQSAWRKERGFGSGSKMDKRWVFERICFELIIKGYFRNNGGCKDKIVFFSNLHGGWKDKVNEKIGPGVEIAALDSIFLYFLHLILYAIKKHIQVLGSTALAHWIKLKVNKFTLPLET